MTRRRGILSRTPLSVTLVASLLLLLVVGLVVAGIAATAFLRGYLVQQVDDQLTQVASQFSERPPQSAFESDRGDRRAPPSAFYVVYLDASGTVVATLDNPVITTSPPVLPALTSSQAAEQAGIPFTVASEDGSTSWRAVATPTREPISSSVSTVQVAQSLASVEAAVRRLALVELGVGAGVVLLLAGLAWWLVRRSLRPLADVDHTAAAIAAGDLSRRVPEADPRTEVGRLSASLNGMLAQIENAFGRAQASEAAARESEARMRRFVADASHELRTPLTSIRGFAELYRVGALDDDEAVSRAMGRIEAEASRMGLLVEDLLLLARMDRQRQLAAVPVDLPELAGDTVHDARAAAPDRDIRLEITGGEAPVVVGDEPSLRAVLVNLVSNAVRYSPADAPVVVRVGSRPSPDGGPSWAVVEVVDRGPGLSPDAAARVFERFYRTDDARDRDAGGTGLGLAIVSSVVASHRGRVELDTAPGAGSTFRVILPLA